MLSHRIIPRSIIYVLPAIMGLVALGMTAPGYAFESTCDDPIYYQDYVGPRHVEFHDYKKIGERATVNFFQVFGPTIAANHGLNSNHLEFVEGTETIRQHGVSMTDFSYNYTSHTASFVLDREYYAEYRGTIILKVQVMIQDIVYYVSFTYRVFTDAYVERIPDVVVYEGQRIDLPVILCDSPHDYVEYTLTNSKDSPVPWVFIDDRGTNSDFDDVISIRPGHDIVTSSKEYKLELRTRDSNNYLIDEFSVIVIDAPNPIMIQGIDFDGVNPSLITIDEGDSLVLNITASQEQMLTTSFVKYGPGTLQVSDESSDTAVIRYDTDERDDGYHEITVAVTTTTPDGTWNRNIVIPVMVSEVNHPPEMISATKIFAHAGAELVHTVRLADPDIIGGVDDAATWDILPDEDIADRLVRDGDMIRFTPGPSDTGTHQISIRISDGDVSLVSNMTLVVAPDIESIVQITGVARGESYNFNPNVTMTFSEPVEGFEASDIILTVGGVHIIPQATPVAGSSGYTFTIKTEPGTHSIVSLGIAGGAFTDTSGNPNIEPNPISFTIDKIAPVISHPHGSGTAELERLDAFEETVATIHDESNPLYTGIVNVTGSIDTSVLGIQNVTFSSGDADAAGNMPEPYHITVNVTDTTPPTFSITDDYELYGARPASFRYLVADNDVRFTGHRNCHDYSISLIADTRVTCTLSDLSGNTAEISAIIKVRPFTIEPIDDIIITEGTERQIRYSITNKPHSSVTYDVMYNDTNVPWATVNGPFIRLKPSLDVVSNDETFELTLRISGKHNDISSLQSFNVTVIDATAEPAPQDSVHTGSVQPDTSHNITVAENSKGRVFFDSIFYTEHNEYTVVPALSFVTIDSDVLRIRPGFDDAGMHIVNITATGAGNQTESALVKIIVSDVNRPPMVCDVYRLNLTLGQATEFDVSDCISDPDTGDSVDMIDFEFEEYNIEQIFANHTLEYPILWVMAPDHTPFDSANGTFTVTGSDGSTSTGSIAVSIHPADIVLEEGHDISRISGVCGDTSLLNATVTFDTSSNIQHAILFHDDAVDLAGDTVSGDAASHINGQPITFLDGAVDIRLQLMESSEIGVSSAPACPCNLTLSYDDLPGINENRLVIHHFDTQLQQWETLETASHDMEANTITTIIPSIDGFSPFAIGVAGYDGSSDGNHWRKKPTFGMSWETESIQTVQSGFAFNDYTLDITNNWHTDFEKTSSIIGDINEAAIKVYAPDGLSGVSLILGIPEIGNTANAESVLDMIIRPDYTVDSDHVISDITHDQDVHLIDPDHTVAAIERSSCNDSEESMSCYTIYLEFVINAPLSHDVIAIQAIDSNLRSTTTYLNHGIEFVGDSLLAPVTATIHYKGSNQDDVTEFDLVQIDRRFPVYEDQFGGTWHVNSFGTWSRLDLGSMQGPDDSFTHVMTRQNTNFEHIMNHEHDRATAIFDSGAIQGYLEEPYTIEFGYSDRMDEEMLERMRISEQDALEIRELYGYH